MAEREPSNEELLNEFDNASVLLDQAGTRSAPGARRNYDEARAAVAARMSPGWQDISTAPKHRYEKVDLWLRDRSSGREFRVPDCVFGNGWQHAGHWITGRHKRDLDGKEHLDQHCTDESSVVAILWMTPPSPTTTEGNAP